MTEAPDIKPGWLRDARRPAGEILRHDLQALIAELVRDVPAKAHRLDAFEADFWRDTANRWDRCGTAMKVSDKQETILRRIADKVYAAG